MTRSLCFARKFNLILSSEGHLGRTGRAENVFTWSINRLSAIVHLYNIQAYSPYKAILSKACSRKPKENENQANYGTVSTCEKLHIK